MEPSISKDLMANYSWRWNSAKILKVLLVLFLVSLILFTAFSIFIGPPSNGLFSRILNPQGLKNILNHNQYQAGEKKTDNKLLGGLFVDGLDEKSCQSRYQYNLYHLNKPKRKPSSYLVSRLRNYEALHKKCGSNTDPYNKNIEILNSGRKNTSYSDCKYIIWTPFEGLGNRMLSLASTFLYALLTNRVLFIGDGESMPDLFCEPFPDVSWLLPSDFPVKDFKHFNRFSPNSYGNLSRNGTINGFMMPPYVYIHMVFDFERTEKLSFCDKDQIFLHGVTWLILKSNLYYIPSLFSIPSFQQELDSLFPEKETVFHHLGRYLYNPSNTVWDLITIYYDSYLVKADEIVGIQIRNFPGIYRSLDQILSCTKKRNLLPEINQTETLTRNPENRKTKAVLITSLLPNYYEEIRKMYWQYATVTGETIAIYQPSHEKQQQTGNQAHDSKALAEIFLLSMSDKLVTSERSTFGYVAQSLGGLRPWLLCSPDSPCKQAFSMEPCYQYAPEVYSCKNGNGTETASVLPYLKECEDMSPSMKLFDKDINLL